MPRFSSPNRAAASKSPARVKSKNLGNGSIKIFDEQDDKRDNSVELLTPSG